MMKNIFAASLILTASVLPIFSQALPATAVFRSAGDPATEFYRNGLTAQGKGNFGGKDQNLWKAYVVFDVVSAVEDLAQNPQAQLKLAIDWVKSPDDVQNARIIYVGAVPKIVADDDIFRSLHERPDTSVGEIASYELAGLKSRSWVEIDLKGVIPSGQVTPVNRYLVFRVEADYPDNPEGDGMCGIATQLDAHSLTIGGGEAEGGDVAAGGY